ncbi:hypothetical protein [Streptomonospora wellingtoniae]|uniref:Uncharacterized protein n=1 Tax=Streptomonospora wellingtoniae TaxID=3075544 RepID=A0ABU2KT92_9ACTN|nr:hypothetical protein [Streptomonospora sp. DSM 45055]MDT0302509.1 hypothetical protein [Streptomonospora sp. DSM 45055]
MAGEEGVGANPNDAGSRGGEAVTVAETFQGLKHSFTTAVDFLDAVAADEGIKGAFSSFGADHAVQMSEIQTHGERMGGNIQAGSTRITRTDSEAETYYYGVGYQYQEQAAEGRGDYDTPMQGLLNRHVNDDTARYSP